MSPSIEAWCLQWLRTNSAGGVTKFGNWWGNAADAFRRTKERSSEEIPVAVGSLRNKVVVVAEAKWTTAPMSPTIIDDLETYKIPALRQDLKVAVRPDIVLFSKSGYTPSLQALARRETHITLVDVAQSLAQPRES